MYTRYCHGDHGLIKPRARQNGPVFITDRGRSAHVLMSMEFYQRLTASRQKIADLLAMPGNDVDFEIPRLRDLARPADFFLMLGSSQQTKFIAR